MDKIIKETIAVYKSSGHSEHFEDFWEIDAVITSEVDLLSMMKEIHRIDARNQCDYPLSGMCMQDWFTFHLRETIINNGEKFINENIKPIETPEYFDVAYNNYSIFNDRLQNTLPNLRDAQKNKNKKERDLEQYNKLKKQFGNKDEN